MVRILVIEIFQKNINLWLYNEFFRLYKYSQYKRNYNIKYNFGFIVKQSNKILILLNNFNVLNIILYSIVWYNTH